MQDAAINEALSSEMGGHDLWKCYLLMEYGEEAKFPTSIQDLWAATKGGGSKEAKIFAALESMDHRAKSSFELKGILHAELSGEDLQKALDLVTTTDTICGNLYGKEGEGAEELIVDHDKLRQLIDSRFVGASSTSLKTAMETLYQKPSGAVLQQALRQIENIRGLAPGTALGQYQIALEKQAAGVEYYKNHGEKEDPSPRLNSKNKGFTASSAQLRFGKVVGDVFGIDAVFGSLISPTGGIAGAGNGRISGIPDGSAVATHGAVHDAAGYLYNCHGIDPGYDYLKSEKGADPSNPLAGQTNINWWIEEFDRTDNKVGVIERLLNSKAHIGAAFSKFYDQLNTDEKKEVLKVMSGTYSITLSQLEIDNEKRVQEITKLMKSCSNTEKTVLANYFYNNNGFATIDAVFPIIKPHVSPSVYNKYLDRKERRASGIQKW